MPIFKKAVVAAAIAGTGLMGGAALSTTAEAATTPAHVTASAPTHLQTLSQDGWGWDNDWGNSWGWNRGWGGGCWNRCWNGCGW